MQIYIISNLNYKNQPNIFSPAIRIIFVVEFFAYIDMGKKEEKQIRNNFKFILIPILVLNYRS